jgi:hypothetical protein
LEGIISISGRISVAQIGNSSFKKCKLEEKNIGSQIKLECVLITEKIKTITFVHS